MKMNERPPDIIRAYREAVKECFLAHSLEDQDSNATNEQAREWYGIPIIQIESPQPFTIWIKPILLRRQRVSMLRCVWIDRIEGSTIVPSCNQYDDGTVYCGFTDALREDCSYRIT